MSRNKDLEELHHEEEVKMANLEVLVHKSAVFFLLKLVPMEAQCKNYEANH